jgi:hypothetical protein
MALTYAANSASDIATEYLLDYSIQAPSSNIYIDPNMVWYTYKYTFLQSINLYSEKNLVDVEHFFPCAIIATNDGYFTRLVTREKESYDGPNQPTQYEEIDGPINPGYYALRTEWVYKFSQKIPFARITEVSTPTTGTVIIGGVPAFAPTIPAGTVIADTMDGMGVMAYLPSGEYVHYMLDGNFLKSKKGSAHYVPAIGLELLKAIDYQMNWNASEMSIYKRGGVLQIPNEITAALASDNVTFIGPEVIVFADQFNWIGNHAMSFYTISNTQIVENTLYYCYIWNGEKLYSFRPPWEWESPESLEIYGIFAEQHQCAERGYYPDTNIGHYY